MIFRGNVYSEQLDMNTGLSVLIPNDFIEGREYKVAYLLHGLHGDNNTWIDNTMLTQYARDTDIIFIMPSALRSFYSDTKSGQKYFSYIADELPHIIKSVFRITSNTGNTAIMGCSMGGYGALKIGLSRPETFGYIGAFSAALLPFEGYIANFKTKEQIEEQRALWGDQMVDDMVSIFGNGGIYNPDDDPVKLAKKVAESKYSPMIYSACGFDDYLYDENNEFQVKMKRLDLNYIYEEWLGEHDWFFFDQALKKAIEMFLHKEQ